MEHFFLLKLMQMWQLTVWGSKPAWTLCAVPHNNKRWDQRNDWLFLFGCDSVQFSLLCSLILTYSLKYACQSMSKVLTRCVSKRLTHSAQLPVCPNTKYILSVLYCSLPFTLNFTHKYQYLLLLKFEKTCWLLLCLNNINSVCSILLLLKVDVFKMLQLCN